VKKEEKEGDKKNEDAFATDEENKGADAVQNENDLDQDQKKNAEAGMNDSNAKNRAEKDSFSVLPQEGKKEQEEESKKAGRGTETEQQERTLADAEQKSERLELVEGRVTSEAGVKNGELFQHVMDQREEDRAALDREDKKDVREQVFENDFDMEVDKAEEEKARQLEEMKAEAARKERIMDSEMEEEKGGEKEKREREEEREKDFVPTAEVARGTDTLIIRQENVHTGHVENKILSCFNNTLVPMRLVLL
jgi:hypothetical protein